MRWAFTEIKKDLMNIIKYLRFSYSTIYFICQGKKLYPLFFRRIEDATVDFWNNLTFSMIKNYLWSKPFFGHFSITGRTLSIPAVQFFQPWKSRGRASSFSFTWVQKGIKSYGRTPCSLPIRQVMQLWSCDFYKASPLST